MRPWVHGIVIVLFFIQIAITIKAWGRQSRSVKIKWRPTGNILGLTMRMSTTNNKALCQCVPPSLHRLIF